jgi:hypothetical protein
VSYRRKLSRAIAGAIRVDRHPYGPRVYVASYRLHHGPAGAILAAALAASGRRRWSYLALAWAATDWRDWPFRDDCNHAPRRAIRPAELLPLDQSHDPRRDA